MLAVAYIDDARLFWGGFFWWIFSQKQSKWNHCFCECAGGLTETEVFHFCYKVICFPDFHTLICLHGTLACRVVRHNICLSHVPDLIMCVYMDICKIHFFLVPYANFWWQVCWVCFGSEVHCLDLWSKRTKTSGFHREVGNNSRFVNGYLIMVAGVLSMLWLWSALSWILE